MYKLRHISPLENPEGPPAHVVEIKVENKKIGRAKMEYYGAPFPLYYIADIEIKKDFRGQRYGSQIMDFIEGFLKGKGRAGILFDATKFVRDNSPEVLGMYTRRGWIEFANDCFAYNLPQKATPEKLADFVERLESDKRNERVVNHHITKRKKNKGADRKKLEALGFKVGGNGRQY